MSVVAHEVKTLTDALVALPDAALRHDWSGVPGEDDWREYTDNLSDVVYLVYQKLRALAVTVQDDRAKHGPELTIPQRILAQHQLAYRDFCGAMAGVGNHELDQTPFAGQWSLRSNVAHILLAECWTQAPQISHALRQYRAGQVPSQMPARAPHAESDVPIEFSPLNELLATFDRLHANFVREFADITEEELGALSLYWEGQPVQVRFRLYRFAWHLRGHTLQADQILVGIGHQLTDCERLSRLLYGALGDAEGALVGAGERQLELERQAAAAIRRRVYEVVAIAGCYEQPAAVEQVIFSG